MALPKVASGTKLLIQVGDGATPEVFDTDLTCALITKTFSLTTDSNQVTVPDCDDPDKPAWNLTEITAKSLAVSGSGVLKTSANAAWFDWFDSGDPKNCRIALSIPAADGGGYFAAPMKLTSYELTGERGNKIQMEVSMQSDGAVTWVPAT